MKQAPGTLDEMLALLEQRAPQTHIALGLDRVARVLARLDVDFSRTRVVGVAGTNGKGSTVAFLESVGAAAGSRVFAMTSPHLVRFAERFRIDGEPLPDSDVLEALQRVEHAREDLDLTWFEHVTLAGFWLGGRLRPDWFVAEVGMGGRLDAVNAVDADVSVITSIGLDHQRWLGRTRAAIAREKCGIARTGRPVIVGEKRRPEGMLAELEGIGAEVRLAGRDFDWRWRGQEVLIRIDGERFGPVAPGLSGRHQAANAACAATAARALEPSLPADAIVRGISRARLAGRFQHAAAAPDIFVDVAHNPAAARTLAALLEGVPGRKHAVFAALDDKDVAGVARALAGRFERWYVAALDAPRGLGARTVIERMRLPASEPEPEALESVADALAAARARSGPDDTIVVFGSFLTAAAALAAMETPARRRRTRT
ncbi:MAG: bifunctional folylpolyglutamate synthase/dihydrofolate synthase [Candidatus Wenzhouxiangella sp. M2_3B_020]